MPEKIIYHNEIIQSVFVTLYSEIQCPYCAVCRKVLSELEEAYFPYLIFNEAFGGKPKPPIQEGSLASLYWIGYNLPAHQRIRDYYNEKTPRTEIKSKPLIILAGADRFLDKISRKGILTRESTEDVLSILSKEEVKKIYDGYYDGLDYSHVMNKFISLKTGIQNDNFINMFYYKLNEREKIINLIFKNLQKLNGSKNKIQNKNGKGN